MSLPLALPLRQAASSEAIQVQPNTQSQHDQSSGKPLNPISAKCSKFLLFEGFSAILI